MHFFTVDDGIWKLKIVAKSGEHHDHEFFVAPSWCKEPSSELEAVPNSGGG